MSSIVPTHKIVTLEKFCKQFATKCVELHLSDAPGPYTRPDELLYYVPKVEDKFLYINRNKQNEIIARQIFLNTPLSEVETKMLNDIQNIFITRDIPLPNYMESYLLRACFYNLRIYGENLYLQKSYEHLLEMIHWRSSTFPMSDTDRFLRQNLQNGVIYWEGRDTSFRPLLVVRMKRLTFPVSSEDINKLIVFCFEWAIQYLFFPGQVESCLVLFDLRSVVVNDFPLKMIPDIIHLLSRQYPCRLNHMYILHDSFFLQTAWKVVRNCLSPMQQEKVTMTRYDFGKLILKNFLPNQIEKDFGGTREKIDSFYPFPLAPGPYTLSEKNKKYVAKPNEWVKVFSSSGLTSFTLRKNSLLKDNMLSEDFYEFRKRNFEDRLEKDKIISILNNDTTRETTSECFESCEDLFSDSKNSCSTQKSIKNSLVLQETHSVEFSPSFHNFQMENLTSHISMIETFPNSTLSSRHHETCFWLPFLTDNSLSLFQNSKVKTCKAKTLFCFKRDEKMSEKTTHNIPRWPFRFPIIKIFFPAKRNQSP